MQKAIELLLFKVHLEVQLQVHIVLLKGMFGKEPNEKKHTYVPYSQKIINILTQQYEKIISGYELADEKRVCCSGLTHRIRCLT